MKNATLIFFVLIMSISASSFAQTRYVAEDNEKSNAENKSRISIMLSDVLVRRLSLEYEYVLSNEKIAINIPFSYTVSLFEDPWANEVHWWAGMGVKFYPTGQGTVRYFVGPEFRLVSVTEYEYNWIYDEYGSNEFTTEEDYINTVFVINNGLIYSPTNSFFVSLNMGVGFLSRSPDSNKESLVPFATPSFRLGFKF